MIEIKKKTNEPFDDAQYILERTLSEEEKKKESPLVRAIIDELGGKEILPVTEEEYGLIMKIGLENESAVLAFLKGSKKVLNF